MAYNGRQDRYQQTQCRTAPQQYSAQNRQDHSQYPPSRGPPERNVQDYIHHQREAYDDNRQYVQHAEPAWNQGYDQQQQMYTDINDHRAYPDARGGQQYQQPDQYHHDGRFRDNTYQDQQYEELAPPPKISGSPQSRPGTSASNRRMKQERILDSAGFDAPKAMAWDNPFGVFPGTKKDAQQKKKATEDARSKSRTETPTGRPGTSASATRPATSAGAREIRQPPPNQNIDDRHAQIPQKHRPQSVEDNPTLLDGLSTDGPYGRAEDVPLRQKRISNTRTQQDAFGPGQQTPIAESMAPSFSQSNRPIAHRAATGPVVDHQSVTSPPASRGRASYEQAAYSDNNGSGSSRRPLNGATDRGYDYRSRENANAQWNETDNARFQNATRLSEDYRNREWDNQKNARNVSDEYEHRADAGGLVYTSMKGSKSMTNLNESPMPNFDAMPANATENIERQVNRQSKTYSPAYRKPTYGDTATGTTSRNQNAQRVPVRPGLTSNQDSFSPNQFDFGLQTPERNAAPSTHQDLRQGSDSMYNAQPQYDQPQGQQRSQFPPRKGSRPDGQVQSPSTGFRHPYNQPKQSTQLAGRQQLPPRGQSEAYSANAQNRRAPRQDYGFDDQGYPAGNNQDRTMYARDQGAEQYRDQRDPYAQQAPPLSRSHTEPVYQHEDQFEQDNYQRAPLNRTQTFESDYDQRQQYSEQGRQPQQYNRGQGYEANGHNHTARPRTANSARVPPQGHAGYDVPRNRPPTSALPMSDRNHPVPVRPGLMNPAPAPSPTVQQPPVRVQQEVRPQPVPQTQQPAKTPVTMRELNELKEAHRNRPNDDQIGLDFAKKLVEAAAVLANEGGRADPKTTAKNRERYVNDALRIVKKLVSAGSSNAMFFLADCYGTGQLGLEVNSKEAFQLYTSAAKLDNAQAAYRVAVCCEMGSDGGGGTRRDYVKAVQFYKKAATLGDGPAMFKMGAILMKGLLGQHPSRREGIQWLKRAAERADAENPHALHELGMIYENAAPNDVVIKDERYAMELYSRAAGLGYKHSQSRLGAAYEYGLMGCPIDPQSSIMWYSKAASQGEHLAEFALSGWYLTGAPPLLEASDQEAYLWARKAASSGLSKAEYAMGYYTETGIGTTPNVEEAKKWYFRAAAQNDERARNRLEEFKRGAGRKERGRVSRSGVGRQNEGECTVM